MEISKLNDIRKKNPKLSKPLLKKKSIEITPQSIPRLIKASHNSSFNSLNRSKISN